MQHANFGEGVGYIRPNVPDSGRPNDRIQEGWILLTIRPNRKAEFDRKAENLGSVISTQYINIFICYKNHLVHHNVLIVGGYTLINQKHDEIGSDIVGGYIRPYG